MGVWSQPKPTRLKDLETSVRVLGRQVLWGVVHPSAHAGCYKQLWGEKGSVGRRAAQVRRRVAVEQHLRSLARALGAVGARGLPGVERGAASEGGGAAPEAHQGASVRVGPETAGVTEVVRRLKREPRLLREALRICCAQVVIGVKKQLCQRWLWAFAAWGAKCAPGMLQVSSRDGPQKRGPSAEKVTAAPLERGRRAKCAQKV